MGSIQIGKRLKPRRIVARKKKKDKRK